MYTKPKKRFIKNPSKTQIYANLTQAYADNQTRNLRKSVCNLRPSALKNDFFYPKKKLGQNFLIDKNIQRKIICVCELKPQDTVLEIGAGRGELTSLIADNVAKVYAAEIDPQLCNILKGHLKKYKNVKIINQDILKFNLRRYLGKSQKIKVIGNIPYYIATPIIEHLLKYRDKIDSIFITVQKEFAKRLIAQSGSKDYSSLSCFVQYYTKPKFLFLIKKTCFRPQPLIDSCFLRLEIREGSVVKVKNERLFFKIIRAAFNQRRKTLRNSLKSVISRQKLDSFFKRYNIDQNIRPEDLTLNDFANLSEDTYNPETSGLCAH